MLKKLTLKVIFTSLFMLLFACSSKEKTKIKIAVHPTMDSFPLFIGIKEGIFESEGINLELVSFESAVEREKAFQEKSVDGACDDFISACLTYKKVPLSIIAVSMEEHANGGRVAILSSPQSKILNLEELKTKEVAIAKNTLIQYVGDRILSENFISPDLVKKISVNNIPIRLNLLVEDKLQAAIMREPFITYAQLRGAHLLADDHNLELCSNVITFHKSFLKKHPKTVKKFMKAY